MLAAAVAMAVVLFCGGGMLSFEAAALWCFPAVVFSCVLAAVVMTFRRCFVAAAFFSVGVFVAVELAVLLVVGVVGAVAAITALVVSAFWW